MSCANEIECFDVTWNIENFSECLLFEFEEDIYLGTSIFKTTTVDGSSHTWWKLYLETGKSSISSLTVNLEKIKGVSVVSKCELSLSSVFGVIKLPQESSTDGSCCRFTIPKSAIFSEKKHATQPQIPKDVITVNCKIWHEMLKPEKVLFGSILQKVHVCYQMNYTSSDLIYDQDHLQITITAYKGAKCQYYQYCTHWYKVLVEILPSIGGSHSFVRSKLARKGGYGNEEKNIIAQTGRLTCNTRIFEIYSGLMKSSFELDFIIAKETVSLKNPYSLHIPSPLDSLDDVHISSDATALTFEQVPVSSKTLSEDLLLLYSERLLSDATINTEGKSFSTHRNILSARSSVFRAMFEKDEMSEGRLGVVDIDDIDSQTVDRMLVFLYGDSLKDLQWEEASALYYAADKYAIHTLKKKCSDILKAGLEVENACDALFLADKHSDEQLMRCTVDFVRDHQEVFSSSEWDKLEEKNLRLAASILREVVVKKGNKY